MGHYASVDVVTWILVLGRTVSVVTLISYCLISPFELSSSISFCLVSTPSVHPMSLLMRHPPECLPHPSLRASNLCHTAFARSLPSCIPNHVRRHTRIVHTYIYMHMHRRSNDLAPSLTSSCWGFPAMTLTVGNEYRGDCHDTEFSI